MQKDSEKEKLNLSPQKKFQQKAHISSLEQYQKLWKYSIDKPNDFWLEHAKSLSWQKFPTKGLEYTWDTKNRKIEHTWFADGFINASYNCLDRHLEKKGNKVAIIWQGEEETNVKKITYKELHEQVCKFANVLKRKGIKKGDRVATYLPMIPELTIVMLACARIGAIHVVVFGGFSAQALADRINDCDCKLIVTSNVSRRNGKTLPFKQIVDQALQNCHTIKTVIVKKITDDICDMKNGIDTWFDEEISTEDKQCDCEETNAEDPLFIIYTSGSTGKPKGVVHTTGGYLLYTSLTNKIVFDLHDDDIYWCTADIGWITGHSYGVYGPLANATTSIMFESVPTYPDPARSWHICDKFKVTIFYTAPTFIRTLMHFGDQWPEKYDLDSLRVLGAVGEPINQDAWMWYYNKIGNSRCPIVDTWWQTETGGFLITPIPGAHTLKPGCVNKPFFGVEPIILQDDGTQCKQNENCKLCIKKPWPSIMRTMWKDHERFIDTYFSTFENVYFSNDGCHVDQDGDYWISGRIDDVVNISGHRLGTAEIEGALTSHPAATEAAVVAIPHKIKGQCLYAYVTVAKNIQENDELKKDLAMHIRNKIGPIAIPEKIQFTKELPKTRSGKIMRRILRKIAEGQTENLGDLSTLSDPDIINKLIQKRRNEI